MVTKELIKAEIDRVQDKYLEVLYKIVQALNVEDLEWHDFIAETYGCLADAPIERGDQGQYEIREAIR